MSRLPVPIVRARLLVALAAAPWAGCSTAPPAPACTIDRGAAAVTVVGRDSPLAALMATNPDVLVVRNRDGHDWRELEVAMRGFETTGSGARRATGRYTSRQVRSIAPGDLGAFDLREFENSRGGRWVSATMQPTDVELTFLREGRRCRASVVVAGTLD